jgi:CRISPR-associated protein Csd2
MKNVISNRYDFVYFFEVTDGNPNGDPDAGNRPRSDSVTGHGRATDCCLKRKIRHYIELLKKDAEGFKIYVKEKAVLNRFHKEAIEACGGAAEPAEEGEENGKKKKKVRGNGDVASKAAVWMAENYYDVRSFGAVMATEENAGQMTGPFQFGMSRSIDPITITELCLTRVAVTSEKESEDQKGENRTMGRKYVIPYALYRVEGFVSAFQAEKAGTTEEDLALLWEALVNMFEHDRSAARGVMSGRRLIVFKHDNKLGVTQSYKLFDAVKVARTGATPARKYDDYTITLDISAIPAGVTVEEKI